MSSGASGSPPAEASRSATCALPRLRADGSSCAGELHVGCGGLLPPDTKRSVSS